MLTINLVTETYDWPDTEDEEPAQEPTRADIDSQTVGFRELVGLMRGYAECSCSPARGSEWEWLTRIDADYRAGADVVETLHYSRDNPSRNLKYWRAAMRAAGFVK